MNTRDGRPVVDRKKMVRQLDARIATTTDARHRKHLGVVREHLDAESDMDLDRLLATVSRHDAVYRHWVAGEDRGMRGWEAIRELYIGALKAGLTVMEFDIETIVVDDHTVVTEGYQYQVAPAAYARSCGFPSAGADDDDAVYLHRFRQTILWHFDDEGRMYSENFYYSGGPGGFRKLAPEEIPREYWRQFELAQSPQFAAHGIGMDTLAGLLAGTRH